MKTDEQHTPGKLFPEFSPATAADWEERTRKDLRDTPLESLTWHTYEDIDIKPYFTRVDSENLPFVQQKPGNYPFMRGRNTGSNKWLNVQQIIAEGDGKESITKAADALTRGADGIHFILKNAAQFDIANLCASIDLTKHTISYTLKQTPADFVKRLYEQLHAHNISHRNLKGFVNTDSLSDSGHFEKAAQDELASILDLTKDSPELYGITVNGTSFSSIGASAVQEIAYTLNAAVAYVDKLTDAGETLESVLRNMQLHLAAGTNYFFEVVKLRVIRLLWANILEAYKAEPALAAQLRIHVSTSSWYQTTLDPYVNMLRATTEAMSAVIAGCDSLAVLPFDSTFKPSDEFSERIARNVSIILKEEAYLDKAIDPAAGSYYLESLTDQLAAKAWDLFREVEAMGGFEQAYQQGFILGTITDVSRRKFKAIAAGRQVLVGTNKYPNPKEKIDFDPEELIQHADFDTTRAAYPTEVMRMATELHLRKRKRRPKAIVAVIGDALKRHINASFAQEFFTCAGFDTEIQKYENVEAASERLLHAAAEVVVVSTYETAYAREFGPKLKSHQAKPTIILANDPQNMKEELINHGFDEFLFEDCDTTAILELIQRRLEQNGNHHNA
ncbi:methylmalonyl-CoA mutase family protein [Pontibacter vulgaris]|uniref:methylmalonyl-CoA mutase family protein n=1 Tax=Pontibacter vulgaris TaxID=2905679 RepID=UPI001FA6C295|nr:methylmalonyl-CoA mutase family protein [Pontibacter vulgaris]